MNLMTTRKIWFLVALVLIVIVMVFCAIILPSIETIMTSFPEILLGQVVLARETTPLYPRAISERRVRPEPGGGLRN